MINVVYFNELSISNLESQNQLEDLNIRLNNLAKLGNLQSLPDIQFVSNKIFTLKTKDGKTLCDFVFSIKNKEVKDFFISKLTRSSTFSSIDNVTSICTLKQGVSETISFIENNSLEDKILLSIHKSDIQHDPFANPELKYKSYPSLKNANFLKVKAINNVEELLLNSRVLNTDTIPNLGVINSNTWWLTEIVANSITVNNSQDLLRLIGKWNRIKLGLDVPQQINKISDIKKLKRLNEVFLALQKYAESKWEAAFEYKTIGFAIRPEGEFVRNNQKCIDERTFKDDGGNLKNFDLHFSVGDDRCYILPDDQNKEIVIGYIGTHLTTKKF